MSHADRTAAPPPGEAAAPRTPETIEAAIEVRRQHLAATLDELAERVRPANLAAEARDAATEKARSLVTDEQGRVLTERVVAVAAAVAALVVLVVVRRRRRRR